MATHFNIPKSPEVQVYQNETFLGVDFTTDVANVDDTKSPDAVNMIRSIPGKVRKRMGHHGASVLEHLGNRLPIYGVHYYKYANVWLVHAGEYLYQFKGGTESYWVEQNDKRIATEDYYNILFRNVPDPLQAYEKTSDMIQLYSAMAERRSTSYELAQMLVILDGKKMLYVRWVEKDNHLECGTMDSYPFKTIPIVRISCSPDGAGTDYQSFNLLSPRFEQDYLITESGKKQLQLYTDKLDKEEVVVKFLQNDGSWITKEEGVDFWVDRAKGTVNFGSVTSYDEIASVERDGGLGTEVITLTIATWSPWFGRAVLYSATDLETGEVIDYPEQFDIVVTTTAGTTIRKKSNPTKTTDNGQDKPISYLFSSNKNYGDLADRMIDPITGKVVGPGNNTSYQSKIVSFEEELRHTVTYSDLPVTPVTGQDNVRVIATYKPTKAGADLINHCTFGVLFGVNGAGDRLFVSGNEDAGDNLDESGEPTGTTFSNRNRDWYSAQYDPTYFPDTGYSVLGTDASAITGYSVVNSYLATFKDDKEDSQTVFIREGDLVASDLDGDGNEDTTPAFKVINTLQGNGVLAPYTIKYFNSEPIFLSKTGICCITSQDITGEKYGQNRSYYLNKKLLQERNLSEALGVVFKDYYVLAVNQHMYILDGLQPLRSDKSEPYSTRQYAGFYFELSLAPNEYITALWVMYGRLYFGTNRGVVHRFHTDENDINSYIDDVTLPIKARWVTPDISGRLFYKNKTFRYIALKVSPSRSSSVKIEAEKNGVWEEIKDEHSKIRYFSFVGLTFDRASSEGLIIEGVTVTYPIFTFMCDKSQKTITSKTRIKKTDNVQFRFSNSNWKESFGLNQFAVEYTQGGNIK